MLKFLLLLALSLPAQAHIKRLRPHMRITPIMRQQPRSNELWVASHPALGKGMLALQPYTPAPLTAQVISWEGGAWRWGIVNKGAKDGLRPGARLMVYDAAGECSIAELLVVHVLAQTCYALVVRASQPLYLPQPVKSLCWEGIHE